MVAPREHYIKYHRACQCLTAELWGLFSSFGVYFRQNLSPHKRLCINACRTSPQFVKRKKSGSNSTASTTKKKPQTFVYQGLAAFSFCYLVVNFLGIHRQAENAEAFGLYVPLFFKIIYKFSHSQKPYQSIYYTAFAFEHYFS